MKKVICTFLLIAVMFSFNACSSAGLPEGFSEDEVVGKAKNAVTFLNDEDYAGVVSLFSEKVELSAEDLEKALSKQLEKLGEFREYSSCTLGSGKEDEIGEFAVAVLVGKYENGKATYTISVDKDGKICGFYMK